MRYQALFVGIVLFFIVLFAGLNWELFTTISNLNLLFTTVEAPLGIVMLVVVMGLSLVYLIIVGTIETGSLMRNRRNTKELEKARKLAESEEQSRYNELKKFLDDEISQVNSKLKEIQDQLESSGVIEPTQNEEKGFFRKLKKQRE